LSKNARYPQSAKEADEEFDLDWWESGFVLVARLSRDGCLDGVYAVYNMQPVNEDGEIEQVTGPSWGMLPESGPEAEHFSLAKMGPGTSLAEFGFTKEITWTERIGHPVEFVRVVKDSSGFGMRVTVDVSK